MRIHRFDPEKAAQKQLLFYPLSFEEVASTNEGMLPDILIMCDRRECWTRVLQKDATFLTYVIRYVEDEDGLMKAVWDRGTFCSHTCCIRVMHEKALHWA